MTLDPAIWLAAILVAVAAALGWRRVRLDVVAVAALCAAVLAGAVPPNAMLAGFASPVVLAVAALGVLSAGVRGSGVLAGPVRALAPLLGRPPSQVPMLGTIGAVLGGVLGTAGAARAFLPVPGQVLRARAWPSAAAVPVALAPILGGLATPLGSVATLLAATAGPLGWADFARVGVPLAAGGVVLLSVLWRLAPQWSLADHAHPMQDVYVSEVHVPALSPAIGRTLDDLRRAGITGIQAVIREEYRRVTARPNLVIEADDVLVLSAGTDTLQRMIERLRGRIAGVAEEAGSVGVVEAVVTLSSRLAGLSAAEGGLAAARIGLLGIGRAGGTPVMRLSRVKLRAGDVLVLQGDLERMPAVLASLGCLKLAERRLRLGHTRRALIPAAIAVALVAVLAAGLPLAPALLIGVLALLLTGPIPLAELYDDVDWPLVIALAALLPLGSAMQSTGLAAALAGAVALPGMPTLGWFGLGWIGLGWIGLVTAAGLVGGAMCGPVVAVLLLPVALALASAVGLPPAALAMAVAIGTTSAYRGTGAGRLAWVIALYVLVGGTAAVGWLWLR